METSRPTRACELKSHTCFRRASQYMSRPTRACELKCLVVPKPKQRPRHALHGRVS